jgi:hypothetical protein
LEKNLNSHILIRPNRNNYDKFDYFWNYIWVVVVSMCTSIILISKARARANGGKKKFILKEINFSAKINKLDTETLPQKLTLAE